MKIDIDGKPLVGIGSMMLGVRPTDPTQANKRSDVSAILETDPVHPGDGGLSCYSDPGEIGIQSKKLILWAIEADDLPSELRAQPAGEPHFHIEPGRPVTLGEFQEQLAATRNLWHRVERETQS